MSIVHEAKCDGCGKRALARLSGPRDLWEAYSHPLGWVLVMPTRVDHNLPVDLEAFCSKACIVRSPATDTAPPIPAGYVD